ncbi:hypothetical protein AB6A40_004571 [Gnathostoma spinigerum]|uniref:Profilin n=1 Tax=Gnathostoma spinigerum TaxID=75299 RepID=A0ABD6EF19_9BILA
MSWNTYVDSNLIATKNVTKAAIFRSDGQILAKSGGFNILNSEAKAAAAAFNKKDDAYAHGLIIGKRKYLVVIVEPGLIIGSTHEEGFFIYKTKENFIISFYGDRMTAAKCRLTTGRLADYFLSQGI